VDDGVVVLVVPPGWVARVVVVVAAAAQTPRPERRHARSVDVLHARRDLPVTATHSETAALHALRHFLAETASAGAGPTARATSVTTTAMIRMDGTSLPAAPGGLLVSFPPKAFNRH
jgi:hypothetical protein